MMVMQTLNTTMPMLPRLMPQNIIRIVPLSQIGYVHKNGTLGAVMANIMAAVSVAMQFHVSPASLHGLECQSFLIHCMVVCNADFIVSLVDQCIQ